LTRFHVENRRIKKNRNASDRATGRAFSRCARNGSLRREPANGQCKRPGERAIRSGRENPRQSEQRGERSGRRVLLYDFWWAWGAGMPPNLLTARQNRLAVALRDFTVQEKISVPVQPAHDLILRRVPACVFDWSPWQVRGRCPATGDSEMGGLAYAALVLQNIRLHMRPTREARRKDVEGDQEMIPRDYDNTTHATRRPFLPRGPDRRDKDTAEPDRIDMQSGMLLGTS
jgi:hypothetical protein